MPIFIRFKIIEVICGLEIIFSSNLHLRRAERNFQLKVTLIFWFMLLSVKFNPLALHLRKLGCKELMLCASLVQSSNQISLFDSKVKKALLHHVDNRIILEFLETYVS